MDERYRHDMLALDTPDDDPQWASYLDQVYLGFLSGPPSAEAVDRFRHAARADKTRLRCITAEDADLSDHPVATFASFDKAVNVGGGRLASANLISEVTVRASHRRHGLLRAMMMRDLTEAKQRGAAVALLTASEGTIYGRFGFAPATRAADVQIDTRRFALARPTTGECSYVTTEQAGPVYDHVTARMLASQRGIIEPPAAQRDAALGIWDADNDKARPRQRLVVHRSPTGEADGLVGLEPQSDSRPSTVRVRMLSADPEATWALWDFAAHLDLVEQLTSTVGAGDPLVWGLVDPRAYRVTSVFDLLWVRVLDPELVLRQRGWWYDGELVLRVEDPLEFAAGTWRIRVREGRAHVAPVDTEPDAIVDVGVLGQLIWGGIRPDQLADAALIDGNADGVVRLFAVADPAAHIWGF